MDDRIIFKAIWFRQTDERQEEAYPSIHRQLFRTFTKQKRESIRPDEYCVKIVPSQLHFCRSANESGHYQRVENPISNPDSKKATWLNWIWRWRQAYHNPRCNQPLWLCLEIHHCTNHRKLLSQSRFQVTIVRYRWNRFWYHTLPIPLSRSALCRLHRLHRCMAGAK